MAPWKRLVSAGLTVFSVFALLGYGCGDGGTGPGIPVSLKFNIELETSALATLVEKVTLTIYYGETPLTPDTLNFRDGIINDTVIVVPDDNVTFVIEALDAEGGVLYDGSDGPRTVSPGETLVLRIILRPARLMLRAAPLVQTVGLQSPDLVDVTIDVYNVDSLFGASFRLHYDTLILNYEDAIEGDFLSDSSTVPTLTFARDSADYVAYSVVRRNTPSAPLPGVSTRRIAGSLVTLRFSTRRVGTSAITLAQSSVHLERPNGTPVNGHNNLVLDPATVRVRAGS